MSRKLITTGACTGWICPECRMGDTAVWVSRITTGRTIFTINHVIAAFYCGLCEATRQCSMLAREVRYDAEVVGMLGRMIKAEREGTLCSSR